MAARTGSAARPKSASRRQTPAMVALEEIGQIRSEVNRRLYEWDQKMQAQNELLGRILQLLEKREPTDESPPVPAGEAENVEPVESTMFATDTTADSADEDAASDGSARCIGYDFSSGGDSGGDSDDERSNEDCAETGAAGDVLEFAGDVPVSAVVPHFGTAPRLTRENLSATAQYLDNFRDAQDFAAVFRKNTAPVLPAARPPINTSATVQLLNRFTETQDFAAVFRKNNNGAQACRLSTNSS